MRILVYGDSNTFGIGPMASLEDDPIIPKGQRWVDHLAAGCPEAEVIVEGLPGRTSVHDDPIEGAHKNGLTVLPAILESHRPIDLMLICLGTNDLKQRFGLRAEDVALGVRRLANAAIMSGHVRKLMIICPPQPVATGGFTEMFAGVEARGDGLATHYRRVATHIEVGFFDANSVIACDPLDGIHFGAEAHATLGAALVPHVQEYFT